MTRLVFPPNPTNERLRMMRNMLACQLESVYAMAAEAPFGTDMILGLVIDSIVQFHVWRANHALPHEADMLTTLDQMDYQLGRLVRRFQTETDLSMRWALAEQIAEATIHQCECAEDDVLALAG